MDHLHPYPETPGSPCYWRYQAMDPAGRIHRGGRVAVDPQGLAVALGQSDLDLISCTQGRTGFPPFDRLRANGSGFPRFSWRRRLGRKEWLSYFFSLKQLLDAGFPMLEALLELAEGYTGRLREVSFDLAADVSAGKSLSVALGAHPALREHLVADLVRVGEEGGRLSEVLAALLVDWRWEEEQLTSLRRALVYPALVAVVLLGVCLFFMFHVLPSLATFLRTLGHTLPWGTRLLLDIHDYRPSSGLLLAGGAVVLLGLVFGATLGRRHLKAFYDRAEVGLPLVGSLRKQLLLTRFLRHFALLYEAGIPVQRCLRLGRETLSNPLLAQAIKVVEEGIEGGAGVARAFAAGGTFSPRMVRMLHVGERSGRLGSALQHLVLILSEETRETVERLGRAVEPTLILVAGGFLIFLICAVLGPVYDVLGRLAH